MPADLTYKNVFTAAVGSAGLPAADLTGKKYKLPRGVKILSYWRIDLKKKMISLIFHLNITI